MSNHNANPNVFYRVEFTVSRYGYKAVEPFFAALDEILPDVDGASIGDCKWQAWFRSDDPGIADKVRLALNGLNKAPVTITAET